MNSNLLNERLRIDGALRRLSGSTPKEKIESSDTFHPFVILFGFSRYVNDFLVADYLLLAPFPTVLKSVAYCSCGGTGANVIMLWSFSPGATAVLRLATAQTACLTSFILQQYIKGLSELLIHTKVEKISIAIFTFAVNPYLSFATITPEYGT